MKLFSIKLTFQYKAKGKKTKARKNSPARWLEVLSFKNYLSGWGG